MNVYSQNDQRWKNVKIGFDTGPNDTLGNYGCYETAIANVCSWAGNDLTPAQVNDLCKQNGWLVRNDLIARDDIPVLLCNNLRYVGKTTWNDVTSMNFFNDASDPDVAYIICIDASNAPGIQTHFVMVWATLGGSDLEIDDSWDGVRKAVSQYGNPSVIIQSATKFIKVHEEPASTPPAPDIPVVEPEPVVVAPPSPATITAPISAASKTPYPVIVSVPKFPSMSDALNHTNPVGMFEPSKVNYFSFNTQQGMVSLTTTPGQSQGTWINPADNVITPPKPPVRVETSADVIGSFKWFFSTHEPVEYKVLGDLVVQDLVHGGRSIKITRGRTIDIYGSFTKGGKTYLRPSTASDVNNRYYFYGIPTTDIYSGTPWLDNEFNFVDDMVTKWESFYDKTFRTIEGIIHPKRKKQ